jgi:DNA-binding transcriptional regulator/RsmH inhibitor MraZ
LEQKTVKRPFLYGEFDLVIDPKNRIFVPSDIRKSLEKEIERERKEESKKEGNGFKRNPELGLGDDGGVDEEKENNAFIVTIRGKTPCFFPARYYEDLARSQIPAEMAPTDDIIAYTQLMFALACKVPWDSQGRALLPEKILKRAGIGKEVTLVGMQDHLELHNRADWAARTDMLYAEGPNIETRVRAILPKPGPDRN